MIVGSGPAAAAAAIALVERGSDVTVVDIGQRLQQDRQDAVAALADLKSGTWPSQLVDFISQRPKRPPTGELPKKWVYGSDYPYADVGQLEGIQATGGTISALVSGAYGGFSTVWGAQILPFPPAAFAGWPISFSDLAPHYKAVLSEIPFAGEIDDLADLLPLFVNPRALPPLAPRTEMVLNAAARCRTQLRRLGVTVGHARLALKAAECVRCGLCMTGCPYSLIYSSVQTLEVLRKSKRIRYIPDFIATHVGETDESATVTAVHRLTARRTTFSADRVFVACGAIGTTRLVLGSVEKRPSTIELHEAAQFVLPMFSRFAAPDSSNFTLNQLNLLVSLDDATENAALLHVYPYSSALADALPHALRTGPGARVAHPMLRRLSVGLGYLPSWASPRLTMRVKNVGGSTLPTVTVSRVDTGSPPPMLSRVLRRLWRSAPYLDLWPFTPKMFISAGAQSYHFGGSFPHQVGVSTREYTTDRVGRLPIWNRVHLVDGSVLPSIPATTFTLTVMANAHRIATEAATISDG